MKKPTDGETDKLRALTEDPELRALMEQLYVASAGEAEPIVQAFAAKADELHPEWRETVECAERDGVILRALFIRALKEARARPDLTERDQLEIMELEAEFVMPFEIFSVTAPLSPAAGAAIRLASVVQKMEMIARLSLEETEKRKRRAMSERGREGGKNSGKARKENRPWVPHATELAQDFCAKHPDASNEQVAVEIVNGWRLETPLPPTVRTLEKFVSELREAGTLPKRRGLRFGSEGCFSV
jgi:hypothetical protein